MTTSPSTPQQPPSSPQPPRRPLTPLEPPSTTRTLVVWLSVLVAIVAVAVAIGAMAVAGDWFGGGGGGGEATPVATTPTPAGPSAAEPALEAFVRDQLKLEYAGDCSASILPKGEGRVCSAYKGERDGRKAYILGPSSYEFNLWVFLEPQDAGWRVYQTQPVKPETAGVPGAPWPLQKGVKLIVMGTGNCLNVRVAPGTKEAAVDCLADGTEVVLEEGPLEADGFQWWRPKDRSGWVAGDWLRYPDEVGAAETTPTPQP